MRALRGDDAAVPRPRPHGGGAGGGRVASRRVRAVPAALPLRGEPAGLRSPGDRGADAAPAPAEAVGAQDPAGLKSTSPAAVGPQADSLAQRSALAISSG